MKLLLALFTSLVVLGSTQAQAQMQSPTYSLYLLIIDDSNMTLVNVRDSSFSDSNKVCYEYMEQTISRDCDGYAQASKLHKVLNEGFNKYESLGLTSRVLMTKYISEEKTSQLLRFSLITEDGYIGFSQGPSYSWKSNSRFYDSTIPSNAYVVVAPSEREKLELINAIPKHSSIGKSWREGNIKLTIHSVFKNGLIEVGESYCSDDSNKGCSDVYTYSLRKPGRIK